MYKQTLAIGLIFCIIVALLGFGCTGTQVKSEPVEQMSGVERIEDVNIEIIQNQTRLTGVGPYNTVAVQAFTMPEQLKQEYPDAIGQINSELINHLRAKNAFGSIVEAGGDTPGRVVAVEGKILDLRFVSGAARFWGGALAGSSYMNIYLKLTDMGTGQVVDEKVITSSANPFGAVWSGGASDRSLPMDMGKIIGEYIYTVLPAER